MLRIYFLQLWYAPSDPATEVALYYVEPLRQFVGIGLGHDRIPDETTMVDFRRLLEEYSLTEALFRR